MPYGELIDKMGEASIGIHTMVAEHFGITIVEMMAAGLLTVTHDSAGPRYDIIQHKDPGEKAGYLCQNEDDYVNTLKGIIEQ